MRVYLDNCMFNRPFDNQSHIRIKLETEAKLFIQDKIKNNQLELIWSYILEVENAYNPHDERRDTIIKWKKIANLHIIETESILSNARKLAQSGVKTKDALHVASAIEGKANYFLTTDDQLLSAANRSGMIKALNPVDYIKVLENDNSNK
jgi:predicted nucleic acid-binding protein